MDGDVSGWLLPPHPMMSVHKGLFLSPPQINLLFSSSFCLMLLLGTIVFAVAFVTVSGRWRGYHRNRFDCGCWRHCYWRSKTYTWCTSGQWTRYNCRIWVRHCLINKSCREIFTVYLPAMIPFQVLPKLFEFFW